MFVPLGVLHRLGGFASGRKLRVLGLVLVWCMTMQRGLLAGHSGDHYVCERTGGLLLAPMFGALAAANNPKCLVVGGMLLGT